MIKWIGQHIWDFISRFRNDVYLEDLSDPGADTDKFLVVDANDKVGYRTGAEVLSDIGGSGGGATTFTLTADSGSNQTIANGNTLDIAGGNAITTVVGATDTVTINHDDTSSQASVDNSGRTYIQDVTLDAYGHVTGLTSATETVTNTNQLTTFVIRDDDDDSKTVAQDKYIKFTATTGSAGTNWSGSGTDGDPWVMAITLPNTTYSVGDGGLTTNDFTNADHTKLNGIEAGAEVNVATNLANGTVNGSGYEITSSTGNNVDISAATTSAWGMMTDEDKTKLDGIATGAEVNVNADWNSSSGDSQILNKPTIPSGNQIIDWTVSQGATDIHADNYTNTTYSEATGSAAGLMSTAHHDKLDGIEASADVTDATNVTNAGALMDTEVTNLAFVKGLTAGISDGNVLTANNAVADDDFLRINGTEVEGRTASEVLSDIGAQAALTFGIGNGNAMKFASDAGAADDDFLRIKGTDIEGLSADEVKTALSLSNVENTALSTYTGQSGALDNQYITNGAGYVTANTMGSGFTVSATTDSNATTITQGDDLFFAAGTGITCETTADGTVTITNTVTDTNTQLTTEQVQDIAGPLVATGGTKTLISVTYDDANNNMDFVVDNDLSNYDNSSSGFVTSDTNTQNSYAISCVDGDNSDEEKIRLTQSGAGGAATDDIVLEAGTGLSIARSSDKITFTNTVSNTDTTYTAGTGLDLSSEEFSVDVSDFMTNGSNDRIVTATGTDGMNAESNLTFNGSTLTVSGNVRASSISHAISGNNAGDYGPGAEILTGISDDTVTAGAIYVLRNGVWTLIDADGLSTVAPLVGVATIAAGSGDSSDGMIIKGCVTLASVYTAGSDQEGAIVYASTTAGEATLTAPTASGDYVRILGYSLNVSSKKMFFNPDSTYIELT